MIEAARGRASYVPNVFQIVRDDNEVKHLYGLMDAALAKIPGMGAGVESRRDVLGKKLIGPSSVNPFNVTTREGDPVREELAAPAEASSEAHFPVPHHIIERSGTRGGGIDLSTFGTTEHCAFDRRQELTGSIKIGGSSRRLMVRRRRFSVCYVSDFHCRSTTSNSILTPPPPITIDGCVMLITGN
jgi:hypothetical protein